MRLVAVCRCAGCLSEIDANLLDTDGYCYDCANGWPDTKVHIANIGELIENTAAGLAKARGISTDRVKITSEAPREPDLPN